MADLGDAQIGELKFWTFCGSPSKVLSEQSRLRSGSVRHGNDERCLRHMSAQADATAAGSCQVIFQISKPGSTVYDLWPTGRVADDRIDWFPSSGSLADIHRQSGTECQQLAPSLLVKDWELFPVQKPTRSPASESTDYCLIATPATPAKDSRLIPRWN